MAAIGIHDLDLCQQVAARRRANIPDIIIATELGVSVLELREACPEFPGDPLGLHRDRERNGIAPMPHRPRGHIGDPFAGVKPYVSPEQPQIEDDPVTRYQRPSDDGGGLALLILLLLLGG